MLRWSDLTLVNSPVVMSSLLVSLPRALGHDGEGSAPRGRRSRESAEFSTEDVDHRVREFRYAKRLISGDELPSVVGRARANRLEGVRAVHERALLREDACAVETTRFPPEATTTHQRRSGALVAEAICSGTVSACASWLVDRLLIGTPTRANSDPTALQAPQRELRWHARGVQRC